MALDRKYETWPDVAKGIGIILVVIGHVWRGLAEAGIDISPGLFSAVNRSIYLFHMPLFFFVAGWFLPAMLRRGRAADQVVRSALRLLYPLVIWTYLFILFKLAAGSLANDPVSPAALLRWPLPAYLHLWFLWALFVLHMVSVVLRPLPKALVPAVCAVIAALSFAGMVSGLISNPLFHQAANAAPYFFLAAAMSHWRSPPVTPTYLIVSAMIFFAIIFGLLPTLTWSSPLWHISALVCVLCMINLSRWPKLSNQTWLLRLGQASMCIYLTHTIFAAAIRIGLLRMGVDHLWIQLAAGVAIGVLAPLLLCSTRVPLGLRRLMGFAPWPIPKRV